ncbi:ABC transporter ATP-binding protein [Ornithinibacillus halotolerans]|uniref:ABC transporter ATP-binding protein YxlF n=1 Tax=Ornithinibacillus halotolerans TaxID=1274357 RepID=A0A916S959_9BACI|nr:ABC transporter ATP-binding protein [Ornithinibacillus halotolerans]GGA89214.1 putative ABC transporter ATP-binding protein YxlF [Ornithinibacillus halotolerans]
MTLVKVQKLTKTYGKKTVVNGIDIEFGHHKCVALIGPNGAGKTTTLRMLAGLLKPTSGSIYFESQNKTPDIREFIGYLPQYPAFHTWMTGREFLTFSGKLANLSKEEANKRADELLKEVGISREAQDERISRYSGGMKQRLGIAQAIIHKPKLLILDEPVASLDPIGRREVLILMEKLKEEMTILFSTHILNDAEEISDELILLNDGKVIESGKLTELRKKYQTTVIELQVDDDITKYVDRINNLQAVLNTKIERDILYITSDHLNNARKEILNLVLTENWPVTTFSINKASLEDMFMKVVNS